MLRNRLVSVVLCFTLLAACLPIFSLSSSADNEGFCQIRIFYKTKDSLGNWSSEKSAIITDNSFMTFPTLNMNVPLQITRFLIRNDSDATCYFQFDINFGGEVPASGTWPTATYSSIAFTTNGGVTAYSFDTTDKSNFMFYDHTATGTAVPYLFNSAASRTFFGKVDSSGYITFTNPVNITFRQNDSTFSSIVMFFRHLVIGTDNSSYLENLENTLDNIDSNVNDIADWMEEEHDLFDDSWSSGGGSTYSEYTSDNTSFWGTLRDLFGFSIFGGLWSLDIFSTSNSLFSSWFSQTNSDNINGVPRRSSPDETEYIDYYQKNINGELDVFGLGGDSE